MREGPGSEGSLRDREEFTYLPISLRYRPYTATSQGVRRESLGEADGVLLKIIFGEVEPSGSLPLPRKMATVDSQFEDVPGDVEPYVDGDAHCYDFAYGLNWSGVIKDERIPRYVFLPSLVTHSNKTVNPSC